VEGRLEFLFKADITIKLSKYRKLQSGITITTA